MLPFALLLALVWGALWAAFLQWTQRGRWLAARRTWLTVVIGVGVDLLVVLLIIPLDLWWRVVAVIAASSLGIIARSLANEHREEQEVLDAVKDQTRQ